MKRVLYLFLLLSFTVSAQESPEVLMTINEKNVYTDEFLAVYNKNRDIGRNIDPKSPEEYLELYVNYKLKVEEALELGMDTLPSFQREFLNYRDQIAKPYLTDKKDKEQVIEEAYQRMKSDVRASHIMKDLSSNASPEDTAALYREMIEIRESIVNGTSSFESVAKEVSTDTYSAQRGGDLGYFTVFNMVYSFETAAYTTPVGEISMPIRTRFGYHLVKTTDMRPSRGKIVCSHILINHKPKAAFELQKEKKSQIDEIYAQLEAGEDFAELAKKYSEDKSSSANGGELMPFGTGQMIDEFEDVAFGLKTIGEYSKPFKTRMGWHIIKLDKELGIPPFEDAVTEIEKEIKKGGDRELRTQRSFIQKLKVEYSYQENAKNYRKLLKKVDESYLSGKWDPSSAKKMTKTLFTIDDVEYSQGVFADYLAKYQRPIKGESSVEIEVSRLYSNYVDKILIELEDKNLSVKYPAFRYLVNEYRDGILLFDLTEKKVWNKAMEDAVGLQTYFDTHVSNYQWNERMDVMIFTAKDKKMAKKVSKKLEKGENPQAITSKLNNNNALNLQLDSTISQRGERADLDALEWSQGIYSSELDDGRVMVYQVREIIPPGAKSLDEAKGLAIAGYQKQLESDWIVELRAKYPVVVDQEVFNALPKD